MASDKPRVDWMPGKAARDALELARLLYPEIGQQELIDRLVITGLDAVVYEPYRPPALMPRARQQWTLPAHLSESLKQMKAIPGNEEPGA